MKQLDVFGNEVEDPRTEFSFRDFERALEEWSSYEQRSTIRAWEAGVIYHKLLGHCEEGIHQQRRDVAAPSSNRLGCCGAASARGSTQMRFMVERGLAEPIEGDQGNYQLTWGRGLERY